MVILPFGQQALLVEGDSLDAVLALHRRLVASVPRGIIDVVPAARTVLVTFDPQKIAAARVRAWIEQASAAGVARSSRAARPEGGERDPAALATVELDIVYDGPDLRAVAELLGVSPEALVAAHQAADWSVAFTGFAPGFGYLVSADWGFDVPRRDSPRTQVPAGAVGLAGPFSGAYPRETPGGWQLIGTTAAPLFDPHAEQPALLTPGTRVRFRPPSSSLSPLALDSQELSPADAAQSPSTRPQLARRGALDAPPLSSPPSEVKTTLRRSEGTPPRPEHVATHSEHRTPHIFEPALHIVEPGLLATIQDLGRPGHASIGVARSGAVDRTALRTANRLLGNPESAAAIEVTMGGFRAVATHDVWFAVTGAWGEIHVAGQRVDPYQAHPWRAGSELRLGALAHGARAYLAVRGGIDAPRVLGSRATDMLSGLGPARLSAGDVVAVAGEQIAEMPALAYSPWGPPADDALDIEVAPGPRADWFDSDAALFTAGWSVSHEADRVGIRLDGPELERSRPGELPSEGMVSGAIQVPPSGRPVILGPDGPVTGGYPVIAVVTAHSLDALAQARPGTRIRFRHARPA